MPPTVRLQCQQPPATMPAWPRWMSTAIVAACLPCAAQEAPPAPVAHVAACGFEFNLPASYRITRPKRIQGEHEGRQCTFDISQAKSAQPPRGECKDKEDGGQPPYGVCDWMLPTGGPAAPSVRVVRGRPDSLRSIDPFFRGDDGRWMLPNAQAGDQPGEPFDFHGKPAWRGETAVRLYWWRQRVKDFTGIYAGTGGIAVTLVQFAPDLFVQLQGPPAESRDLCPVFCPSLRLGARAQDLP